MAAAVRDAKGRFIKKIAPPIQINNLTQRLNGLVFSLGLLIGPFIAYYVLFMHPWEKYVQY